MQTRRVNVSIIMFLYLQTYVSVCVCLRMFACVACVARAEVGVQSFLKAVSLQTMNSTGSKNETQFKLRGDI